jgi:3'(2'), 5'-bisphosphate nucleotidase
MDLTKELELCNNLAQEAGKVILDIYQQDFSVEYKQDKSPLTIADKKANDLIVEKLQREFPNYAVLSEESQEDFKRLENDWCWVVDPLDGTKEFIKRNGEFTVNIALTYKHKVVLGVIYAPILKKLYYATKGIGSYCMDEKGEISKLNVSNKVDSLIAVGSRSHGSERLQKAYTEYGKIEKIVAKGSSLKGCLVAAGEADLYYRDGYTMEWDTAAMQCIAEEAGAIFRQLDNSEMLYNRENSLNDKGFYIINKVENKICCNYSVV